MPWSINSDLNNAKYFISGTGDLNALCTGGEADSIETEEFNTNSWSFGGNLLSGKDEHASFGTQNAAVVAGGGSSLGSMQNTQEYNGTSWTNGSDVYTNGIEETSGAGSQNAGLVFQGRDAFGAILDITREYDGSTWSAGGTTTVQIYEHAGFGTQNAAVSCGGRGSDLAITSNTETYDGTSWTTANVLNTGRSRLAASGEGTLGLSFGGYTGSPSSITEKWDGTTWTVTDNLNTARYGLGGAGSQLDSLSFGGYTTSAVKTTEKYTSGYNLTGTITNIFTEKIEGAIVSVGNLSDASDANGNYSITGLSSGNYNITTTATNYFPDIHNASIPPISSYDPVLYPVPNPTKDSLTIMYPLEMNEESDIEVSITKNFNNSIVTQISKKTEVKYNYVDFILNESAKEMYYDYIGYQIKVLNVLNQSIPNVYLIDCSFEKMTSNVSYWKGYLSFLKL